MIALENVRYSLIMLLILVFILVKAEGGQSQVRSSTAALPKDFAPVKAIIVRPDVLPLYPVDDPHAAAAAVAVRRDRQTLSMLNEQGNML